LNHHVASVFGDRQMFNFAEAKFDMPATNRRGVPARFGQHFVGHVHADDVAGRADLSGGEEAIRTPRRYRDRSRFRRVASRQSLADCRNRGDLCPFGYGRLLGVE